MKRYINRGRTVLLAYLSLLIGLSLLVLTLRVILFPYDLHIPILRTTLTVLLSISIYRGNTMSAIILVVCAGIGGAYALASITPGEHLLNCFRISFVLLYFSFAVVMFMSLNVRVFLDYQRGIIDIERDEADQSESLEPEAPAADDEFSVRFAASSSSAAIARSSNS